MKTLLDAVKSLLAASKEKYWWGTALKPELNELQEAYDSECRSCLAGRRVHPETNMTMVPIPLSLLQTIRDEMQGIIDNDTTPEPNCSCHIAPPCGDCEEHGAQRETIQNLKDTLDSIDNLCIQSPPPYAWARAWYINGEENHKIKRENGRWVWKYKLLPVTQHQCLSDDIPLYR